MKATILGGSYTGLINALSLAAAGAQSTIVEQKDDLVASPDPRTTALNPSAKKWLEEIGVNLEGLCSQIHSVYIISDNKELTFSREELETEEPLGYLIPNALLKEALLAAVKKNPLISAIRGKKYDDILLEEDLAKTTLSDGSVLESELVIAADGSQSKIKEKYFGFVVNKAYNQFATVLNISHTNPHNNSALEYFMPGSVLAVLPLRSEYESAIVWSMSNDIASAFQSLNPEEVARQLEEKAGDFIGQVEVISPITHFPLQAQITDCYFHERIILAGEAAHSVHPLAGQGLNMTINDAKQLQSTVKKYMELGIDINGASLKEYQRARALPNLSMLFGIDMLDRFFTREDSVSKIIQNLGFSFLEQFPQAKNWALKRILY